MDPHVGVEGEEDEMEVTLDHWEEREEEKAMEEEMGEEDQPQEVEAPMEGEDGEEEEDEAPFSLPSRAGAFSVSPVSPL